MLTVAGIINAFGITIFLSPVKLYDSGISGDPLLQLDTAHWAEVCTLSTANTKRFMNVDITAPIDDRSISRADILASSAGNAPGFVYNRNSF